MGAGLYGLYKGLEGGVTGIFAHPYAGIRHGGVGFVTGVGRGLLGAVGLPISGVLDLVGHVLNGVASTTGVVEVLLRVERPQRPPLGVTMVSPTIASVVGGAWEMLGGIWGGVGMSGTEGDEGSLAAMEMGRLVGILERWPMTSV